MSLVIAPKMVGRKGGMAEFAGGNQSAGSLKEFFETNFMPSAEVATPTAGGTLTLNGVNCGSYDYVLKRSNQDLTSKLTFSDWFTTTEDTRSAIVGIVGNLTLRSANPSSESGATGPCIFRPRQRKLFMAVYVQGDLNIESAYPRPFISMTARGANHSGSGNSGGATTKCAIRLATGTYSGVVNPEVPASGGAGGGGHTAAEAGQFKNGANGSGGGLGGGGGGGASNQTTHTSGAGSAGTSFASGSGGGGAQIADQGGQAITSGGANGGAGGNAQVPSSYNHYIGAGAGNPAGLYNTSTATWNQYSIEYLRNNNLMEKSTGRLPHGGSLGSDGGGTNNPTAAYQTGPSHHYGNVQHMGMETRFDGYDSGCAGTLIVFCSGTMTGSGRIASNGLDGGSDGGGGTGGGHVSVFYGTNSSSYSIHVDGQLGQGYNNTTGGTGGVGTGRMMAM